jgi:two-component system sensor histidine kinase ChvG
VISPLTNRILAVNLLALAIPVVSILFLAQYQQRLIDNELIGLRTEARLFSVAIAEGCVDRNNEDVATILPQPARAMIRHLVETTTTRTQLFDTSEHLIADSHQLMGPGGVVQLEELPPLEVRQNFGDGILDDISNLISRVPGRDLIPPLPRHGIMDEQVLEAMRDALDGNISTQVWRNKKGGLVFVAAAPVQDLESVLGAVMLVRDGTEVDSAIRSVRLDVLKVSGVAIAITIILSLYLAGKIARPIRTLAAAAVAQTQDVGQGRQIEIPDFARRHDEIGDLSIALRQMTQALWQRMDAIEGFAADVAHELKNPLTSLRSAVETVARVEDPAQKARLMAIINDDVGRMDRLISDISNASRLDAELSRVESQPVDLCALLKVAVDLSLPPEESGIVISFACLSNNKEGEKLHVFGIEGRLMQVFQNLLDNAVSFSPKGGKVDVAVKAAQGFAEITIDDEGPGLPENKLANIFERFYTERPAGEAFGKHSGLGLSIAKQIVEAHRGKIAAANRAGFADKVVGARFTVKLPLMGKK